LTGTRCLFRRSPARARRLIPGPFSARRGRRDEERVAMSRTPVKPKRRRLSGFILDYLLALPLGCAAALAWANTLPESYYRCANATAFVVNDVGMAFFFALITKEVVEATLPGGDLHPWRRAALPVVAATGSVIVSIAIYLAVTEYFG